MKNNLYAVALLSLYAIGSSFAEEPDKIVPLTEEAVKEMKVVVTSPDKEPVIKLLKPDLAEICETIITDDLFPPLDIEATDPGNHCLVSDTTPLLRSRRIPIVWKEPSQPDDYGCFTIKCGALIKKWKIRVVNSRGKNLLEYEGEGKAPDRIDIKENDIKNFNTGEPYSPILILHSSNGKKYRFYGDAFSFDAIIKREKGIAVANLSVSKMFDKNNLLTEKGKDIISSLMSVLVQMNEPFLEIKCRTTEKAASRIQTQNFINILKSDFLIPAKNIKAELFIYSKFDYPFIELIIKESKT